MLSYYPQVTADEDFIPPSKGGITMFTTLIKPLLDKNPSFFKDFVQCRFISNTYI